MRFIPNLQFVNLCLVVTSSTSPYPRRAIFKRKNNSSQGSTSEPLHTPTDHRSTPLHCCIFFFCCKCSGETGVKLKSCLGPQDLLQPSPSPRFFAALDAFCWGEGGVFCQPKADVMIDFLLKNRFFLNIE